MKKTHRRAMGLLVLAMFAVMLCSYFAVPDGDEQVVIREWNPAHQHCDWCHGTEGPSGDPTKGTSEEKELLCLSCHGPGGVSVLKAEVHGGDGAAFRHTCLDCHNPHIEPDNWLEGENLKNVGTIDYDVWPWIAKIDTPNSGLRDVVFESYGSGDSEATLHSFADSDEDGNGVYDGICEVCHTQTAHHTNSAPDLDHYTGGTCIDCHTHDAGFAGACNSCHASPPQTGSHLAHYGEDIDLVGYGGTDHLSTPTAYGFDCGTCHPMELSSHMNGAVDIELYNPAAPPDSLKGMNPPTASYVPGSEVFTDPHGIEYTLGTCSDVYCHSKTDWSSPDPISDPIVIDGEIIVDENGNLTYEPYVVTEFKVYTSMTWGDPSLGCNDCHRLNPQTSYPEVQGGVGNTHANIDDWGYENLHAWNMSYDPLFCRVCHYSTVQDPMTWTRDSMDITTYDPIPISDKSYHVNGQKDVAFDAVNPVFYGGTSYDPSVTQWEPAEKTCDSAPCHKEQCRPQWGMPYRPMWGSLECDYCHHYGYAWPDCPPAGKDGDSKPGVLSQLHMAFSPEAECVDCHDSHGRDRSRDNRVRVPRVLGPH